MNGLRSQRGNAGLKQCEALRSPGTAFPLIHNEAGSRNVSVIYYCTILDDANFFINQAKGLPVVPSANPLRDRYIRMGILCSWIALEEMLAVSIEEQGLSKAARRVSLRNRLDLALRTLRKASLDGDAFVQARAVRNCLTHPRGDEQPASLKEAVGVFNFCFGAIRDLFLNEVGVRL